MKMKVFALLAVLMTVALPLIAINSVAAEVLVYLDPREVTDIPICEEFTLTIRINAFENLYAWTVDITWDPEVLEFISASEGGCLKSAGLTLFLPGTVTPGKIEGMMCTLMGSPTEVCVSVPPAPNDFATITFHVIGEACESPIDIPYCKLKDCSAEGHYPTTAGSTFTNTICNIYSSYANGTENNEFEICEDLYVTVPPLGIVVDFYVCENRCWTPGDSYDGCILKIPDVRLGDLAWETIFLTHVDEKLFVVCNWYDIAMDTNQNGIYDDGDLIDTACVVGGFHVIPELALGTVLGLSASIMALAGFTINRRRR